MFRRVVMPRDIPGTLLLHGMPGRLEDWSDFRDQAVKLPLDLLVALTSRDEIEAKSPDYAVAIQQDALPCERWEHPIADFGVPADRLAFAACICSLAERIEAGATVLIHCTAGIGRTGTAAICVLHALGLNAEDAAARVQAAGSRPLTPEQRQLVTWHDEQIRRTL